MAEKKYLDLTGLGQYTVKIKEYADNAATTAATTEAGKVDAGIRKDYKVKDVDTKAGAVALTLDSSTGKVGVTFSSNIVVDAEYNTVKANANNSAAAWTKFLKDSESVYPNNITPALKDLATTSSVTSAIATAKGEAIAKAGELDTALKGEITTAYQSADADVKTELIGVEGNLSGANTIWGAKKYADEKSAVALQAASNAQTTADAAQDAADAAQDAANTAQTAAETADGKAVAAQNTANEIKNTTIPALKTALENKITANTNLINSTKDELIGGESDTKNSNSIKGAKLYAKDLTDSLSTRIDSIVAGGVTFKGVVSALPSAPKNGDLIIVGKEGGITVGNITYKKDYEYIYSEGAWYELGDSDKNAKAIAEVKSIAAGNTAAINNLDTAYKAADSNLSSAIDTVSKAAVKSIEGGKSTYVTVSAGTKGADGKVTLTVSDSIAATFDTITNVNSKISTAKNELKGDASKDTKDSATIVGAKKYTDDAVKTLENSFIPISQSDINSLFA